jgi:hypothetical protein
LDEEHGHLEDLIGVLRSQPNTRSCRGESGPAGEEAAQNWSACVQESCNDSPGAAGILSECLINRLDARL